MNSATKSLLLTRSYRVRFWVKGFTREKTAELRFSANIQIAETTIALRVRRRIKPKRQRH